MSYVLRMKTIESGYYKSEDGRVVIKRVLSQGFRIANQVCWALHIDGKWRFDEDTYRDAKARAVRILSKEPS